MGTDVKQIRKSRLNEAKLLAQRDKTRKQQNQNLHPGRPVSGPLLLATTQNCLSDEKHGPVSHLHLPSLNTPQAPLPPPTPSLAERLQESPGLKPESQTAISQLCIIWSNSTSRGLSFPTRKMKADTHLLG